MRPACVRARAGMRVRVPDGADLPVGLRAHVDRCLRCAAFEARERRLARAMRGLATRIDPVPGSLEGAVLTAIGRPEGPSDRLSAVDRVWKSAAVAAAVAIGVVVARRKLDAPV